MELMRVLHVHSGNPYGGVETMLTTMARRRDACPEMQQQFATARIKKLSGILTRVVSLSNN